MIAVYTALGDKAAERQKVYEEYVSQTIPEEELKLIRDSIQRNQVTGGNRFREQLEKKLKIRLSDRGPKRPKKSTK
jgi:putative transposase